jgi:hypothetical protein
MLNEVVLMNEIVVELRHEQVLQYEINSQTNNQMKELRAIGSIR